MPPPDGLQTLPDVLTPVSGPSFTWLSKLLATALVVALLVGAGMLSIRQPDSLQESLGAQEWGFLLAVAGVIGSGYWGILTSRTCCDGLSIEQTWLWRKQVRIADITQVKLISVPGLEWLVVPRLVVRTGFGLTTFHAGDPLVLARFKLLAHGA